MALPMTIVNGVDEVFVVLECDYSKDDEKIKQMVAGLGLTREDISIVHRTFKSAREEEVVVPVAEAKTGISPNEIGRELFLDAFGD